MPLVSKQIYFETGGHAFLVIHLNYNIVRPAIVNAPVDKCRPADGGEIQVNTISVYFDLLEGHSIESHKIEHLSEEIKLVYNGEYDDELYDLAIKSEEKDNAT